MQIRGGNARRSVFFEEKPLARRQKRANMIRMLILLLSSNVEANILIVFKDQIIHLLPDILYIFDLFRFFN